MSGSGSSAKDSALSAITQLEQKVRELIDQLFSLRRRKFELHPVYENYIASYTRYLSELPDFEARLGKVYTPTVFLENEELDLVNDDGILPKPKFEFNPVLLRDYRHPDGSMVKLPRVDEFQYDLVTDVSLVNAFTPETLSRSILLAYPVGDSFVVDPVPDFRDAVSRYYIFRQAQNEITISIDRFWVQLVQEWLQTLIQGGYFVGTVNLTAVKIDNIIAEPPVAVLTRSLIVNGRDGTVQIIVAKAKFKFLTLDIMVNTGLFPDIEARDSELGTVIIITTDIPVAVNLFGIERNLLNVNVSSNEFRAVVLLYNRTISRDSFITLADKNVTR
ncbi:MAG: hypothetical protein QW416_07985 [Candidatus Nitrosocaldaceae archaeon]